MDRAYAKEEAIRRAAQLGTVHYVLESRILRGAHLVTTSILRGYKVIATFNPPCSKQ